MGIKKTQSSITLESEQVIRVPLSEIHPFKGYPAMQAEMPFHGQPYRVRDDDPTMIQLSKRIKENGVSQPVIVRPDPEGGYEIISGERRHRASELAEIPDLPVIIREMSDDRAVIELVDANIHRENVLPSEKAWAYRMRMEAMKRQSGRASKENVSQVGTQKRSDQLLAEEVGESRIQVYRYVRLTELIPELMKMHDEGNIKLNPAYELSFLTKEEQTMLLSAMDYAQATPSLSQAQRLKKLSQAGGLTDSKMEEVMSEEKKSELDKVTLPADTLRKYFPKSYTPQRMQETIIKLLEQWQKKRQQQHDR